MWATKRIVGHALVHTPAGWFCRCGAPMGGPKREDARKVLREHVGELVRAREEQERLAEEERIDQLIVDHVAVDRALKGDRAVWDRLRVLERQEVEDRAYQRYEAEVLYIAGWNETLRKVGGQRHMKGQDHSEREWFHAWCETMGVDPVLLRNRVTHRRRKANAVPAAA